VCEQYFQRSCLERGRSFGEVPKGVELSEEDGEIGKHYRSIQDRSSERVKALESRQLSTILT
jgi:hypothetical protein